MASDLGIHGQDGEEQQDADPENEARGEPRFATVFANHALTADGAAERPVGLADFLRVYHGHGRHVHDIVDFRPAL